MRLQRAFSIFTVAASMIVGSAVPAIAAATSTTPAPATSHPAGPPSARGCDPIAGTECLLPFPNDWYTTSAHTPTGRRLALTDEMTPKNAAGKAIDPAAWNISDGFSPGSMLLAQVPGLDLAKTGAAPVTDVGRSLERDAPIVIVDTRTDERWPYWAEVDANATDPARQALIIRPAKNFLEGHHYAVALRDLKDSSGARIAAPATFTHLAEAKLGRRDPLAARQDALRGTLKDLGRAGVGGKGLYLAWDFTVASEQGIAGQVLDMRDDALRGLHGRSPEFTVTSVTDFTPEQDANIAREVKGEFLVPNYLDQPGGPPGSKLNRDPRGDPARFGDDVHAQFQCEIPRAAFTKPAQPSLYGHGLLGSISEVHASNVRAMAGEHDFTFCATAWIGMASEDIANVTGVFGDYSHFDTVVDRLQQSLVDFVFLGRTMITKDGLASDKAFQDGKGHSLIDSRADLVYDGNSQGSIAGGAAVAVSPDVRLGVLGVAGMNYSTLLNRSVDFAPFQQVMNANYPDKLDQQICFALQQILWDRAETDGYAQHLGGDPLPGSPRHRILTQVAFGDHQVSNVTAEVEARTMGARIHQPAIAPGRNPDVVPYWGIKALPHGAYAGSAMVVWDSGTPAPPLTNTPPAGEQYGVDPHEDPRADATARTQKAWFLKDGVVVDVCGGRPCTEPHAG